MPRIIDAKPTVSSEADGVGDGVAVREHRGLAGSFVYNRANGLPGLALMNLLALGLNHETAGVALRERAAFSAEALRPALRRGGHRQGA